MGTSNTSFILYNLISLIRRRLHSLFFFFFFNDTATTEIYTLSLHDALPISSPEDRRSPGIIQEPEGGERMGVGDRKSTRLNSSHSQISYAVFCLKKKKKTQKQLGRPTQPIGLHAPPLVLLQRVECTIDVVRA